MDKIGWIERATARTQWLGRVYLWKDGTESTQDDARRWVVEGAPDGALVLAGSQTKGRGRLCRTWFSPPRENLYLTILIRIPLSAPLGFLGLFIAVQSCRGLRQSLNLPLMIKWPNDLFGMGRKAGGILIEVIQERGDLWALVGIGINVNVTEDEFPLDLRDTVTSLRILNGAPVDRGLVLEAILLGIEEGWENWTKGLLEPFIRVFNELDYLKGRRIEVVLPDRTVLKGTAEGISAGGQLILRCDDGLRHYLSAGEASVRR